MKTVASPRLQKGLKWVVNDRKKEGEPKRRMKVKYRDKDQKGKLNRPFKICTKVKMWKIFIMFRERF